MNLISRILTGIIMVFVGLVLIFLPLILQKNIGFVALIYGLPILVIGIVILLNNGEDKIERIKDSQSSVEDVKREQIKSNKKLKNERRSKK